MILHLCTLPFDEFIDLLYVLRFDLDRSIFLYYFYCRALAIRVTGGAVGTSSVWVTKATHVWIVFRRHHEFTPCLLAILFYHLFFWSIYWTIEGVLFTDCPGFRTTCCLFSSILTSNWFPRFTFVLCHCCQLRSFLFIWIHLQLRLRVFLHGNTILCQGWHLRLNTNDDLVGWLLLECDCFVISLGLCHPFSLLRKFQCPSNDDTDSPWSTSHRSI